MHHGSLPVAHIGRRLLPTGERQAYLLDAAAPGPWLFHSSEFTDATKAQQVEEALREQIFLQCSKEIPYIVTQRMTSYEEEEDGTVTIEAELVVKSLSQKVGPQP